MGYNLDKRREAILDMIIDYNSDVESENKKEGTKHKIFSKILMESKNCKKKREAAEKRAYCENLEDLNDDVRFTNY